MATYRQIAEWVKAQYGFVPKDCWIAHCKELCGLEPRRSWRRRGERRVVPCPPDRRPAIMEAFKHFGMVR